MRPRVHHLEGSEPVYDGGDVLRLARAGLMSTFLAGGHAVEWAGYFRAALGSGYAADDALQFVLTGHRLAFGQDVRGTDFWAGLVALAGEVYGS